MRITHKYLNVLNVYRIHIQFGLFFKARSTDCIGLERLKVQSENWNQGLSVCTCVRVCVYGCVCVHLNFRAKRCVINYLPTKSSHFHAGRIFRVSFGRIVGLFA